MASIDVVTVSTDEQAHRAEITVRRGGRVVPLRIGRWTAELRGDELADVAFDGVRLLRAIRPVVRDEDWNTAAVRVVSDQVGPEGIVSQLHFDGGEVRYDAVLSVTAVEDELLVQFRGTARSDFLRNRIGLVVLHRSDDAGTPVDVRHTDGAVESTRWPRAISPHQPFRDVAGFAWSREGIEATIELSGDVFETEDQRNWTDASFKTYSTPLDRPFPVAVAAGDVVRQSIRLSARGRGQPAQCSVDARDATAVTVGKTVAGSVPGLVLTAALQPDATAVRPGRAASTVSTSMAGSAASGAAPAGHYEALLVELTGTPDEWPGLLDRAREQADALAVPLDVRMVTDDAGVVDRTVQLLHDAAITRLAAFDPSTHLSSAELWQALTRAAARYDVPATLVGGTRAHFTELNRQQSLLPPDLPALSFSITPQMHAVELAHLVDSLETQRTVVDNARRIAGVRPLHIGPITLRRRFNAVSTGARPDPAEEARAATDPLQRTGFAAAWTLGSIAALAVAGVETLAYYETIGPRGRMDTTGGVTPAGALLDTVAAWRGRSTRATSGPPGTAVLATENGDGCIEVLLGDLTGTDRTLSVVVEPDSADADGTTSGASALQGSRGPQGRTGAGPLTVALPAWSVIRLTQRAVDADRSTDGPSGTRPPGPEHEHER